MFPMMLDYDPKDKGVVSTIRFLLSGSIALCGLVLYSIINSLYPMGSQGFERFVMVFIHTSVMVIGFIPFWLSADLFLAWLDRKTGAGSLCLKVILVLVVSIVVALNINLPLPNYPAMLLLLFQVGVVVFGATVLIATVGGWIAGVGSGNHH